MSQVFLAARSVRKVGLPGLMSHSLTLALCWSIVVIVTLHKLPFAKIALFRPDFILYIADI